MVFGHNTNLKLGSATFHIQTEDRGVSHALIDTTVYYHGRVLHRRTNNYFDLLPMNEDREQALRLRLDEQHRNVIEEIRSGVLQLPASLEAPLAHAQKEPVPSPAAEAAVVREPAKLHLELTNAKSWLSGKHAKLQIVVRDEAGKPVSAVDVKVEFEGSDSQAAFQSQTNAQGETSLEFELPRIVSPEAAMVIYAENQRSKGHLRFAMRAKPRVVTG